MVELMVAMTLGLLLMAAVLQTFVGAKRTYEFQQEFSRIQENGRFAMNFLTKAIRQADYWGCLKNAGVMDSNLEAVVGSDPTVGFEAVNKGSSFALSSGLGESPDLFTVRGGREGGIPVTENSAGVQIKLDKINHPTGMNIDQGDILIVTDCIHGEIFQVTTTNSATKTVTHNSGIPAVSPGNAAPAGLSNVYGPPDAVVYAADSMKFWIRTGAGGEPALVRGSEYDALTGGVELVEGIENLQLLLGYDTNGDGVAESYAPPPPAAAGDPSEVVAVQVNLVARSLRDNITDTSASFDFNGQTYTPTDRRLRKVFTTNVAIRNRLN